MFFLKQDAKKDKVYVSLMARVPVDCGSEERVVSRLGAFDKSEVKKTALLLSGVICDINCFIENDDTEMTRRTGNEIKNTGCIYVKEALNSLGLADFWKAEYKKSRSHYDYRELFYFLVASTIIDPMSIRAEVKNKGMFIDDLQFEGAPVYRFLDEIYFHCMTMQAIMYRHFEKLLPKDGRVRRILYDGTNIYFEIKESDFDTKEEYEAAFNRALRTMGFSKENRPKPIVNIGLFADVTGDVLGWNVFPGKEREVSNVLPPLKLMIHNYPLHCFCFIADRGNYSGEIIHFLEHMHDYYIIGKSIRQSTKELQDFALEAPRERKTLTLPSGDRVTLSIASRIIDHKINYTDKNGKRKSEMIKQKQIVTFNAVYARREKHKREEKKRKSEKLIKNPAQLHQKMKAGPLELIDWKDKEGKKPKIAKPVLNEAKIKEQEKHDGQYVTVTDLLKAPDVKILKDYKLLFFAERDFRILKSMLDLRPVYVWKNKHIVAHIAICIFALQVIRYLETKVNENRGKDDHIFNPEEIIYSLRSFQCYLVDKARYFIPGDDEFIEAIAQATGVGFDHKYWTLPALRKKLRWSSFKSPSKLS